MRLPTLLVALSTAFTVASAFRSSCVPDFADEAVMYNVFQAGRGSAKNEGGAVFLSETDSPENGAWYISPAEGGNGTFTLSLASKDEGVQCLRSVGRGRQLTTGACGLEKAQFTLSCSTCPPSGPSTQNVAFAGRACVLRSLASPEHCVASVVPPANATGAAQPGLAELRLEACRVRTRRQAWDFIRA
ncbi:hypothetical protein JCM10213_001947 [Rhodosporidiobolus nylandii]